MQPIVTTILCCLCRSIRIHVRTEDIFSLRVDNEEPIVIAGYFTTRPQIVDAGNELEISDVLDELVQQVDQFNSRGVRFFCRTSILVRCCRHQISSSACVIIYKFIANKLCVINVQNTDDHKCFVYAILSCLFPDKHNPQRVSSYRKYEHRLNIDGLTFPSQTRDIPKFESQNQDISVNVLYWDEDENEFNIEYLSPERKRHHHVNLLMLSDGSTRQYVWIKNMFQLVAGVHIVNMRHVCNSFLNRLPLKKVWTST